MTERKSADDRAIERTMALAIASWVAMLIILISLLAVVVIATWPLFDEVGEGPFVDGWFVSAMALVAILPSLAVFAHRYIFHHNRTERGTVSPPGYLKASLVFWGSVMVAGIWSAVGALASDELIPNVVPLFIAMFLLLGTWPNGKAMVKPRSRESDDDTEIFHIPPEDE